MPDSECVAVGEWLTELLANSLTSIMSHLTHTHKKGKSEHKILFEICRFEIT